MYFVTLIYNPFVSSPGGLSNVVKTDYFSNFATTIITRVNDFEVLDNYMFATKPVSGVKLCLAVACVIMAKWYIFTRCHICSNVLIKVRLGNQFFD